MTTLYTYGGTSGSGKSTRVYALYKFLKTKVPYSQLYSEQGKPTGTLFDNRIVFLGKEIQRGNCISYQGIDILYRTLGGNHVDFYNRLFELASEYSVIAESAVLLRTFRSRPAFIAASPYIGNFNVYCKFYYYDLESEEGFNLYRDRIFNRSGNIPNKESAMWKSNNEFHRYVINFNREKSELPEEQQKYFLAECGDPSEDLSTIGVSILEKEGMEDLIPEFIEFCNNGDFIKKTNINKRSLF